MQNLLSNITLLIVLFLSSYFFFYIPGKLINNRFLKSGNDFLISSVTGFSIFTLLSYLIYEINLKISYSILLYFIYSSILSFFFYRSVLQKNIIRVNNLRKNLVYLVIICILLFLLYLIKPIYLQKDGSDMWYYLAIIRSLIDDGYFSNDSPWFNTKISSYPSNSFFQYLTMIKYLFPNISLFDIFRIVGIFLTSLSILINTYVLNFFIKNIRYSFSIIFFIFVISFIFRGNLVYYMTTLPYYPKIFSSLIFIPTLIYIFFSKIYTERYFAVFLVLILIAFINQSSINIIISGVLIFTFIFLEFDKNIFIKKIKNIFVPLAIVVLFTKFYLSGFYFEENGVISTYSNDLSINSSKDGPYFGQIIEIFKGLYIYNPIKYFSDLNYFYLLISGLTIFSYKSLKNNTFLFYHYFMLLVSFLIVFNPISIFILNKLLPINFLVRINWIFVGYIFVGCLIYEIIKKFRYQKILYKFMMISSTLCCLILSGIFYKNHSNNYENNIKELEKYMDNIEVGSLVITDKYTSNKVLALKKVRFLISHELWIESSTPSINFDKYYELYDNNDLFINKNIFNYLLKIDGDYLLINKKITTNYNVLNEFKKLKVLFDNNTFLLIEI